MNTKAKPTTTTSSAITTTTTITTTVNNEAVPIFLRKTYHMIDTCDTKIACWSEDGETFVVKNTDVFEKTIIPQFFKHSKFSSFVRQLNFYGFRKIKYADTIRIDPKLEAATANFWRFRHDKFQRGKPALLIDIKRSNGQQSSSNNSNSNPSNDKTEDAGLKNEVSILKKRIEAMTKNIDHLTSLVQKVTIKEERSEMKTDIELGSKRKKMDASMVRPDETLSHTMDLDEFSFNPSDVPSVPPAAMAREPSNGSNQTDDDFVEQLYTAFGTEDMGGFMEEIPLPDLQPVEQVDENAPDPKLMKKLSDALTLLPKEIQEMIVNRLVSAITGTEGVEKNVKAVSALSDVSRVSKIVPGGKVAPNQVPPSPVVEGRLPEQPPEQMPMPLAAATLAALLKHFNSNVKGEAVLQKPLPPVIPIHA